MEAPERTHLKRVITRRLRIRNLRENLRKNEAFNELEKLELEELHDEALISAIYKEWT